MARLNELLEGRRPDLIALCLCLRDWIAEQYPKSHLLLYDGYATSVVFSSTTKLGGAFAHIAVYKKHLNLGFNQGTLLEDPDGLLKGTGKLIRHLRVENWESFPEEPVARLLAQAFTLSEDRNR
jgi:uncharacterized protein DUF1801